jgi:Putative glutamine amidotransferase
MNVVWSEIRWITPAAVTFGILFLLIGWQYAHAVSMPPWARWAAATLKLLGFALLLLFLLAPQTVRKVPKPGVNWVAVAADNSASMSIADQANGATRGDTMREVLARPEWQKPLGEQFQIRDFLFDARTRRAADFSSLTFDGPQSAVIGALDRMRQQFEGQPLAAILLFTDGAATDFSRPLPGGGPPVYPVLFSPQARLADASIEQAHALATVFENAPVTVDASVRCLGAEGRDVKVRLIDERGQTVTEEHRKPRGDDETFAIRFLTTPQKPGPIAYRVEAVLEGDAAPQNNARHVVANRDQGPFRILYVAGQPNWEHKFLQRALADDPELKLVSLLRVARGVSKFDWRARGGGGAHPFYADQVAEDEAERYDQPIFMRLGTRDAQELRDGFPRTAEELAPYDVVMLDNVESTLFSRDQLGLLRDYVGDRGGSLIMLGGADSLDAGKYQDTPLADVLPIYLGAQHSSVPAAPVRVTLSREGLLLPWARLRTTEREEQDREAQMPDFLVAHGLDALKPGARAIASLRDASGREYPAIASQKYGNGLCTAFMIGDLWRWGMQSPEQHADLDKFWRQTTRATLADVPRRATLTAGAPQGGKVELAVVARGPDFRPAERVTVTTRVRTPADKWTTVEMEPDAEQPGRFVAQVPVKDSGPWRAEAIVTDATDGHISSLQTGWATNADAEEFRALRPDPAPIEALARQTGGRVLKPEELEKFVEELKNKPVPEMESLTAPLWHSAIWLALAMGCFVGEWSLRRWKGLA